MSTRYRIKSACAMRLALVIALIAPSAATAQAMIEVPMRVIAQLGVNKAGQVERCGYEILGFHAIGQEQRVFDVSLYVYSQGYALGKLTATKGTINAAPAGMVAADIYGGWIRAKGTPAAVPTSDLIDGETPKSKLYQADITAAMETLYGLANGDPAQIAIYWNAGHGTVYFGKPQMDPGHDQQFLQCMQDLQETIQRELKLHQQKSR